MARKKIDLAPFDAGAPLEEGGGGRLRAFLIVFTIIATAAVLAIVLFQKPKAPYSEDGAIEIRLPLGIRFAGEEAKVAAFSSCGPFEIFFDGKKVGEGETSAEATLFPSEGSHTVEAKNSRCFSSSVLTAVRRECSEGQEQPCEEKGCPGARKCLNGFYSSCSLPKKICVPGEMIGCSTNGCEFGYATCNPCGTGYGQCLPRDQGGGAACAGGSCG